MKDLLYSDVETQLREGVRDALARRSPVARVLAQIESGQPYDRDLWHTLAVEMGLAGIAVPEKFGGGGGTLREAGVVLEELGRGVAPVPFLSSAVVATATLLACGAGAFSQRSSAEQACIRAEGARPGRASPTRSAATAASFVACAKGTRSPARITPKAFDENRNPTRSCPVWARTPA